MSGNLTFLLLLISSSLLGPSLASDEACTDLGGSCVDYRYYICHGGVETGLCEGDSNRRCCLPCDQECQDDEEEYSQEDGDCTAAQGDCFDNSNYCEGVYGEEHCGGPDDRQCCRPLQEGDCPKIVTREEWGARPPSNGQSTMASDVHVFVHHSVGNEYFTYEECEQDVRNIQDYHMDVNLWSDVGYNFLICGEGSIFEGRGWGVVGAHTYGYNLIGHGIDFLGDFTSHNPSEAAIASFDALVACGVIEGAVSDSYQLRGHRQTCGTDCSVCTECPGNTLYETIKGWQNYQSTCLPYIP